MKRGFEIEFNAAGESLAKLSSENILVKNSQVRARMHFITSRSLQIFQLE